MKYLLLSVCSLLFSSTVFADQSVTVRGTALK